MKKGTKLAIYFFSLMVLKKPESGYFNSLK